MLSSPPHRPFFLSPFPSHHPFCNVGRFEEDPSWLLTPTMHQAAFLNTISLNNGIGADAQYLIEGELSSIAGDSQYVTQQQLAMVDKLVLQQQLSTPTMHPNLVSTLKSIIAPTSPLQHADQPDPNPGCVLAAPCEDYMPPFTESLIRTASEEVPQSICAQDLHKLYQCSSKFPDDPPGAAIVPVDLIQNRRPFKCSFMGCDKTFRNPQTLKMHHKTHYSEDSAYRLGAYSLATFPPTCKAGHNKKIPSKCPICKRTFVGLYELRRHFGRKHSEGEKMHGCRKCGKKFYIEVDLRDHEKLCGEPLQCKCGMKFAFKCNLVAHKRTHPDCQDSDECKGLVQATGMQRSSTNCKSFQSKAIGELNQWQTNLFAYAQSQQQQEKVSFAFSACDQSFQLMESFAKPQCEDTWLQCFPWVISRDKSSSCLMDIGIVDVAP